MSVSKINLIEQVVGYYRGEQADIEALSDVLEHSIAFGWVTDPAVDGAFGYFNGSAWIWSSGGGGTPFDGNVTGHLQLSGIITELLPADVNDWNPAGLATASIIRIDTNPGDPVTIYGLEAQADGDVKILLNIGADLISLFKESLLSDAENRFGLWAHLDIYPGRAIAIFYDGPTQRWMQMGVEFSLQEIRDYMGDMVSGNTETGISVTYSSNKLHFDASHTHEVDQRADIFNDGEGDPAPVGTAADGSSTYASRRDHVHGAGSGSREKLTGTRTYYVRTDGNDSNTGLVNNSGGAFLTIQKAIDIVAGLDLSIYDVTIQIGAGTYSSATSNTLKQCVGAGQVIIIGDETTPANVIVSLTAGLSFNGACFFGAGLSTIYNIRGIQFKTTATGNYAILANKGATVQFQNCDFNAGTQNFLGHLRADNTGTIQCTGNYKISASCQFHALFLNFGSVRAVSITVTLTGTPAWGTAMLYGLVSGNALFDVITFSGAATGKRYQAESNAVIYTNGGGANYFPGNVAGTTATGAQYI